MKTLWLVLALAVATGCGGGDSAKENNTTNVTTTPNNRTTNVNPNINPNVNPNNTTNVNPNNTTNVNPNNTTGSCGDGVVNGTETCDNAIAMGDAGSCPVSCPAIAEACTTAIIIGDASDCSAVCEGTTISTCVDDDGCCPPACSSADDNDCGEVCGNGVVEGAEICDGDCPANCDDGNLCTEDVLTGSPGTCDAVCANSPITACMDGDNCCPAGCDPTNDAECNAVCGNGMTEPGESCDGDCAASCDDSNACTTDTMNGTAATCDVTCNNAPIMACTGGDGCCPANCNVTNDSDCSATCGNGVVEMGETCDGDCPVSCNDMNACTTDSRTGSAGNCNVTCQNTTILACTNGDGCCPSNCNATNDNDCSTTCGNGIVEAGETCDGNCPATCDDGNACTVDGATGSAMNCNRTCTTRPVTQCINGDGCCAPGCLAADDNDCAQTQPIGGACNSGGDCISGGCLDDPVTGGYCTSLCTVDGDCAVGSHCGFIDADDGIGVCLDDCAGNGDCRGPDYECYDGDLAGVNECWPIGNGAGLPGAACDEHADCAGGQSGYCVHDSRGWQDGYCAQTCTAISGCPNGSHCGLFDTNTGMGICMDDCAADGDCRADGYLCYDFDQDAVTECAAASTGTGVVGDACTQLYECAGGVDGGCFTQDNGWRNGYCTEVCSATNPCPTGSHCGAIDGAGDGVCLKDCAGNGQCRLDGYQCLNPDAAGGNECWPSATGTSQVGGACTGYWECVGGLYGACITGSNWPGGYCTIQCGAGEGSCTATSSCESTTELCFRDCATTADCRTPYVCDTSTTPPNICI